MDSYSTGKSASWECIFSGADEGAEGGPGPMWSRSNPNSAALSAVAPDNSGGRGWLLAGSRRGLGVPSCRALPLSRRDGGPGRSALPSWLRSCETCRVRLHALIRAQGRSADTQPDAMHVICRAIPLTGSVSVKVLLTVFIITGTCPVLFSLGLSINCEHQIQFFFIISHSADYSSDHLIDQFVPRFSEKRAGARYFQMTASWSSR